MSMDMLKIEQVIVGNDVNNSSKEVKTETLVGPLQSYRHESLQCFQCYITFRNSQAKERHMKKSHRELYKQQLQETNTVFTCYKCDKCFSSSEVLSRHQVSHDTEEKSFQCSFCENNFCSYSELKRHRRYNCIERQRPCKDCGALFSSPARLRNHLIAMHPQLSGGADVIRSYQCFKCSRCYQTKEELLPHQEKCDIKPPVKKRGHKIKMGAKGEKVHIKKLKEEHGSDEGCNSNCSTKGFPSNEQERRLEIPCSEENCDLLFPSVTALRGHKRAEHGPTFCKPQTSTECNESYAKHEHISQAHCSGFSFSTGDSSYDLEDNLTVHQKGVELVEKEYHTGT